MYDELFVADKIEYNYENIKFKLKQQKKMEAFNMDNLDFDDGGAKKQVRSESALSDSDSDDEDGKDAAPSKKGT